MNNIKNESELYYTISRPILYLDKNLIINDIDKFIIENVEI